MDALAQRFVEEARQRLDAVFAVWAAGQDVPPGDCLRLEGFMQAGIVLGLATRQQLLACMTASCRLHCAADLHEKKCGDIFPPMTDTSILPLPPMMRRAPVVPSTRD